MKKIYLLLLLVTFPLILFCQTRFTVTKPRLELSNENPIIEYNILNTDPSDLFEVWIEVTNASGFMINAQSLSGDVGENITGGINKRILWNLDNRFNLGTRNPKQFTGITRLSKRWKDENKTILRYAIEICYVII